MALAFNTISEALNFIDSFDGCGMIATDEAFRLPPDAVQEALESLAAGSYRCCEVVLVNDGGAPPEVPADYPLPLVRVDLEENRGRAAAANAGIEAASGDFVSFLDDDDLAAPEHLAVLAGAAGGADVQVVYSDAAVGVYELQGEGGWLCVERRLPYSRDFDPGLPFTVGSVRL